MTGGQYAPSYRLINKTEPDGFFPPLAPVEQHTEKISLNAHFPDLHRGSCAFKERMYFQGDSSSNAGSALELEQQHRKSRVRLTFFIPRGTLCCSVLENMRTSSPEKGKGNQVCLLLAFGGHPRQNCHVPFPLAAHMWPDLQCCKICPSRAQALIAPP